MQLLNSSSKANNDRINNKLISQREATRQQLQIIRNVNQFEFTTSQLNLNLKTTDVPPELKISCMKSMTHFSANYNGKYFFEEETFLFGGIYKEKIGLYVVTRDYVHFYYFKNNENPKLFDAIEVKGRDIHMYRSYTQFRVFTNGVKNVLNKEKYKKGKLSMVSLERRDLNTKYFQDSLDIFVKSLIRQSPTYYDQVKELAEKNKSSYSLKVTPLSFIQALKQCNDLYRNSPEETIRNTFKFVKKVFSKEVYIPERYRSK